MLAALLLLAAAGAVVAWAHWTGALDSLTGMLRDAVAKLYPSRPSTRRALPRRLLRAAERTVTVGVSGTALVPTRIEIRAHPEDLQAFTDAMDWLGRDVAAALRTRALAKNWTVPDGPHVTVLADPQRPLRMPHATGYVDALDPDDVRTLARPDGSDTPPSWPEPRPPAGSGASPHPDDPTLMPPPVDAPEAPTGVPTEVPERTRAVPGVAAPAPTGATQALTVFHFRLVSTSQGGADVSGLLSSSHTSLMLGRSRHADLRVRDESVSGRHCAFGIDPQDNTLTVEDLGSTNGTYVGGQRTQRASLRHGDILTTGGVSWRVEMEHPVVQPESDPL